MDLTSEASSLESARFQKDLKFEEPDRENYRNEEESQHWNFEDNDEKVEQVGVENGVGEFCDEENHKELGIKESKKKGSGDFRVRTGKKLRRGLGMDEKQKVNDIKNKLKKKRSKASKASNIVAQDNCIRIYSDSKIQDYIKVSSPLNPNTSITHHKSPSPPLLKPCLYLRPRQVNLNACRQIPVQSPKIKSCKTIKKTASSPVNPNKNQV